MKITLKSICIFVFLLLPALTHAAANTYYVTQNGNGARSGNNVENAWSVSDFNALTGSYHGDTFFFSGNFSSQIRPQTYGADGNHVILDGYEVDDTTYMNLSEAPGRAKIAVSGKDGIDIMGGSYITIQDFEITDCSGNAVEIRGTSNDITLKRTFIYEQENGIISYDNSYNITIGGKFGHGNVLKNIGINTAHEDIALMGTHDIIISYNHLYATEGSGWGIDGVLGNGGTYDILVEYNSIHGHNRPQGDGGDHGEDGIDFKKASSYNIIIRFNNIYNHLEQTCVTVQSGVHDVYIYGNRCHGNENGICTGDAPDKNNHVYIFGNVISEQLRHGIWAGFQGTVENVTIFNNTLAENGTKNTDPHVQWGNIAIVGYSKTAVFKNNILYKGRPNDNSYQHLYIGSSMDTIVESNYNQYFWPSQTSSLFWGSAGSNNLEMLKAGSGYRLPQEANSREGDPGLTDIENNDYTIASASSTVVDAGVDMGSGNIATLTIQGDSYPVPWDFALGPNTDWSVTPPVVDVLHRDIVGWDIGAYAYEKRSEKPVSYDKPVSTDNSVPADKPASDSAPKPPNARIVQ